MDKLNKHPDNPSIRNVKWKYFGMLTFLIPELDCTYNENKNQEMDICDLNLMKDEIPFNIPLLSWSSSSQSGTDEEINLEPILPTDELISTGIRDTEIDLFFHFLSKKVIDANLAKEQIDEIEEQLLVFVNRKLKDFRN